MEYNIPRHFVVTNNKIIIASRTPTEWKVHIIIFRFGRWWWPTTTTLMMISYRPNKSAATQHRYDIRSCDRWLGCLDVHSWCKTGECVRRRRWYSACKYLFFSSVICLHIYGNELHRNSINFMPKTKPPIETDSSFSVSQHLITISRETIANVERVLFLETI